MFETLTILPVSFWVVAFLLVAGAIWAAGQIRSGIGLPMLAVLGTVATWYVGDALYNHYASYHAAIFASFVLANAWWQVALFLVIFLVLAPMFHQLFNRRDTPRSSQILGLFRSGIAQPRFQLQMNQLFWGCLVVWSLLAVVAAMRLKGQLPYYFFPFLAYKADPWSRGQIGTGIDSLLSLAFYLQMFLTATFGVVMALSKDPRVRSYAVVLCGLTWPYFVFDRNRSYILAAILPAVLAWVFLRLRRGWWQRIAVLAAVYSLVSIWFAFVLTSRNESSVTAAVRGEADVVAKDEAVHHEGLNMFEELCWINTFIEVGTYKPNWGERYFAELVNPIPRSLWPGKPLIGLDYAIARGQAYREDGTVTGTISTGMIGQGVVNFGRVFGPAFAAFLMSLWAAILARLDLTGHRIGRLPLYAFGLVLTFNLGRDITLIILYAFVFGVATLWCLEHYFQQPKMTANTEDNELPAQPEPEQGVVTGKRARARQARRNRGKNSDVAPHQVTSQPTTSRD